MALFGSVSLAHAADTIKIGLAGPVTGAVDFAQLSALDRDLLKDSLSVVKRFKVHVQSPSP